MRRWRPAQGAGVRVRVLVHGLHRAARGIELTADAGSAVVGRRVRGRRVRVVEGAGRRQRPPRLQPPLRSLAVACCCEGTSLARHGVRLWRRRLRRARLRAGRGARVRVRVRVAVTVRPRCRTPRLARAAGSWRAGSGRRHGRRLTPWRRSMHRCCGSRAVGSRIGSRIGSGSSSSRSGSSVDGDGSLAHPLAAPHDCRRRRPTQQRQQRRRQRVASGAAHCGCSSAQAASSARARLRWHVSQAHDARLSRGAAAICIAVADAASQPSQHALDRRACRLVVSARSCGGSRRHVMCARVRLAGSHIEDRTQRGSSLRPRHRLCSRRRRWRRRSHIRGATVALRQQRRRHSVC
mmetsp:Transcript_2977/g.10649  ORF Transcript_2977/g.10649 Transcript_2977/m.10649 type:complete len:351 (-) Transcript_2977:1883-2935(-)